MMGRLLALAFITAAFLALSVEAGRSRKARIEEKANKTASAGARDRDGKRRFNVEYC